MAILTLSRQQKETIDTLHLRHLITSGALDDADAMLPQWLAEHFTSTNIRALAGHLRFRQVGCRPCVSSSNSMGVMFPPRVLSTH